MSFSDLKSHQIISMNKQTIKLVYTWLYKFQVGWK